MADHHVGAEHRADGAFQDEAVYVLAVIRCIGAARARGCIGCSTSEKRLPASSPSIRNRAPIPPRMARWPSFGPRMRGEAMVGLSRVRGAEIAQATRRS